MNEQQQSGEQPEIRPRVYVASLSDYNDMRLHGVWLDAAQSVEELDRAVQDMLDNSQHPGAEEYAVHDHEGWHGWTPAEFSPLGAIAAVGAGLVEHGPAFGHWIAYLGEVDDGTEGRFEEAFLGEWPSVLSYAENLTEDLGLQITVEPEPWSHYVSFDHQALARDLEIELHVAEADDGGVYLFDPNA